MGEGGLAYLVSQKWRNLWTAPKALNKDYNKEYIQYRWLSKAQSNDMHFMKGQKPSINNAMDNIFSFKNVCI